MITYDLNHEDVANLIQAHLCDDLYINTEKDYSIIRSESEKFFGMVKVFGDGVTVITEDDFRKISMGATAHDYTSLFVAVTPRGIFQYNLSLIRPEFETYSDADTGDIKVADLSESSAVQILEWYPEFSSEDEYLDTLMADNPSSDDFFLQELIDEPYN